MRGKQTGLVEHVRKIVRSAHIGTGKEFTLAEVRAIGDKEAWRFLKYVSTTARDGALRRMLQDERDAGNLDFVRRGIYRYPQEKLLTSDSINDSDSGMSTVPVMLPPTRKDAQAVGAKTYHRASPCPRCHTSVNYTSSGCCRKCQIDRASWTKTSLRAQPQPQPQPQPQLQPQPVWGEGQDEIWLPRIQAAFDKLLVLMGPGRLSKGAYDYLRQSYSERVFGASDAPPQEQPEVSGSGDGLWQRRRRWPATDTVTLRKLAGKKPAYEIAARLGRTETGVRSRAHALGISLELVA